MTEISALIEKFGPVLALVLFYIWRDYIREDRLVKRVEELENYHKTQLVTMIKDVLEVISDNTGALKDFVEAVKTRPCLLGR